MKHDIIVTAACADCKELLDTVLTLAEDVRSGVIEATLQDIVNRKNKT